MSQWYYVDAGRHRHGPVDASALVELWSGGRIGLDTLVWREGQAAWQPLETHRTELGLPDANGSAPPPLPPLPAGPAQPVQGARPLRAGMSGCLIALVIGLAVLVPGIGILAAIALPAYQDYTLRAKVASAVASASPLKTRVAEHLQRHGRCPSGQDPGFDAPEGLASGHVISASVGQFESNFCGIELTLGGTGSDRLDAKALWLEYRPDRNVWKCSSEIDDRYLPQECRG